MEKINNKSNIAKEFLLHKQKKGKDTELKLQL